MHVRLREKQSVISRAEVKATTQPHIPSGRRKCNPKATNLNSEIHKSFCHFRSGEQESRWGAGATSQQDPSPAQTGTDQLRTEYWSSSVNLFLVPFLIFFLIWLPVFSSTISESYYHMFTPQTWHHLKLRSPGLLHSSLKEPPLGDAEFAPLANFSLGPKVTKSRFAEPFPL